MLLFQMVQVVVRFLRKARIPRESCPLLKMDFILKAALTSVTVLTGSASSEEA